MAKDPRERTAIPPDMAVQTDDEPKDSRIPALIMMLLGLAIGVATLLGAYLFTYAGIGPGTDDPYGRAGVTSLIILGVILALAFLIIGGITFFSRRRAYS